MKFILVLACVACFAACTLANPLENFANKARSVIDHGILDIAQKVRSTPIRSPITRSRGPGPQQLCTFGMMILDMIYAFAKNDPQFSAGVKCMAQSFHILGQHMCDVQQEGSHTHNNEEIAGEIDTTQDGEIDYCKLYKEEIEARDNNEEIPQEEPVDENDIDFSDPENVITDVEGQDTGDNDPGKVPPTNEGQIDDPPTNEAEDKAKHHATAQLKAKTHHSKSKPAPKSKTHSNKSKTHNNKSKKANKSKAGNKSKAQNKSKTANKSKAQDKSKHHNEKH